MNEEYKQIECISKMKKEYFDKFCTIVEGYREKISDNLSQITQSFCCKL